MIYFTSDLHFSDKNVLILGKRPFKDISTMNDTIIDNWNSVVNDDDIVYIIGDIFGKRKRTNILYSLKGEKRLIMGNHDKVLNKEDLSVFSHIFENLYCDYKGHRLFLNHYPVKNWIGKEDGSIHIHGHIHSAYNCYNKVNFNNGKRIIDVGVDCNDFTPISIDQVLNKFNIREVK